MGLREDLQTIMMLMSEDDGFEEDIKMLERVLDRNSLDFHREINLLSVEKELEEKGFNFGEWWVESFRVKDENGKEFEIKFDDGLDKWVLDKK